MTNNLKTTKLIFLILILLLNKTQANITKFNYRGGEADRFLEEMSQLQRLEEKSLIFAVPSESDDQKIILLMKKDIKWERALASYKDLTIQEYKQILKNNHLDITQTSIKREIKIFATPDDLKTWCIKEIAPLTSLSTYEYDDFGADYTSYALNNLRVDDRGIHFVFRQLLIAFQFNQDY